MPVANTDGRETWRIEAKAPSGEIVIEHTTDGSYTPDPFDCLFGVWEWEDPEPGELAAVTEALGAEAVADLAQLLGL